ncbi:hypothetical protein Cgig2_017313 [Carnegiea gigantea]|uniref:Uncharacterized protein n=1 Tax=Carnegiea gigantea TaxID=171969 RepID=A0A9Q1JNS5_9CARY|nr:hypothetical protein Cgig2_017313 [Carnegiea gigantea]
MPPAIVEALTICIITTTDQRRPRTKATDDVDIVLSKEGYPTMWLKLPVASTHTPHNTGKYYEFHEQNGFTATECKELTKPLDELMNKAFNNGKAPPEERPCKEGSSTEIIATIATGCAEVISHDSLKNLKHLGKDISPLVHPILGFGSQTVTLVGVINFPLLVTDKTKSRNTEVDFLVVQVPTIYNGMQAGRSCIKLRLSGCFTPSNLASPDRRLTKMNSVNQGPDWSKVSSVGTRL